MKNKWKKRSGEGYIDTCVLILCAMLVIALAVKVLPVYVAKQQLDTFAAELVREAEITDRVGSETTTRAQVLSERLEIDPDIRWSRTGRIQLNEEVNENYDDVYHSVREGYAAGWFPEGDGEWFESIDAGDIYGNLSYILGLTTDGEGYMKYAGNELEYTLSDLSVHISNNAIASGRSEGYLATATLHLEVPTRFAGRVLPPVSLNLQVQAKYIPKF